MAKTVLITGANRGIGQQVARVLATDGWDVLVGGRDRAKADSAAKRLRGETGGRLRGVELDVTSETSVTTAAQKLRDGAIRIDALVNNAGIYRGARELILETNFFGVLRTIDAMLPLMNDGGSITNVTSGLAEERALRSAQTRDALVAAVRAAQGDAYAITKGAMNVLSRILARDLAARAIRVNATCPGWVRTDMGGRGAPRSVEEGGASVVFGVTTTATGGVFRDGKAIA